MAKYRKYAEYKDSGVEWLGDIPQEWSIVSIARVSNKITNGYVGATRDIFYDSGIRYLQSLHIKKNKINFHTPYYVSEDWNNEKSKSILKEGDVLIVQTGDIGQVAAVTKEFEGCNCHALIIVSGNEKIWGFYLSWLLNSDYGRQTLKSIQTGALHPHLNCDAIKDVKITLPDIQIQKNISNFLDHETAKIDILIAKQEKLIELLKEKRQAVISHAVTKGLNPNVPMKDSGVEWLGEVPEHWEVKKIKYLGSIINGYAFPSDEFTEEGVRVLKISNIQNMFLDWSDLSFVSEQLAKHLDQFSVKKGDLVFALTRPIISSGIKAAIVESSEKILLNQRNAILRPNQLCIKKWLYFIILNGSFVQEFNNQIDKTGQQPNISTLSIGNLAIPVAPINEQKKIVEFIEDKLETIDQLIVKAQSAIQLMQERRTALISAAVTGKIDVRNWQHPNQKNNNHTELGA